MKRIYLAAGLSGLLLFLVAYVPAPLLYHWSRTDMVPQIQVFGARGNLWQGQATSINLAGIQLQTVRWQLRPLSLLILRVSHRVTAQTEGGELDAVISRSLLGTLRVSSLKGSLPVEQLGPSLQLPVLPVSGRMQFELDQLKLSNGRPIQAKGVVEFKGLVFSFTSPPAALGSYRGELSTTDEIIKLTITSESGDVEANGSAEVKPEGQYTLDLKLRPRATASASVSGLLQSLGRSDAEGWYLLRRNGVF
jgi:general secretion pathway protein N